MPVVIASMGVLAVAFYVDTRYIRMVMSESDQFVERSRCFGDFRRRNQNKPLEDTAEKMRE